MTKAEIQSVKSLHSKEGRNEQALFICEGVKLIEEVRNSHLTIRQLYSTADYPNSQKISPTEMSRISALKSPTDLLALVEIPRYNKNYSTDGLSIVLDGVQDPGNMGTIIRLASWFGIKEIYCSLNSADCFNPKVVQATMGAIARVRVHYTDLVELLRESKKPIYGTFLEGETIFERELATEGYIVMGSEGQGISAPVAALITDKLYIPSFSQGSCVESLNVAVATAIVCYEFRRAKH